MTRPTIHKGHTRKIKGTQPHTHRFETSFSSFSTTRPNGRIMLRVQSFISARANNATLSRPTQLILQGRSSSINSVQQRAALNSSSIKIKRNFAAFSKISSSFRHRSRTFPFLDCRANKFLTNFFIIDILNESVANISFPGLKSSSRNYATTAHIEKFRNVAIIGKLSNCCIYNFSMEILF